MTADETSVEETPEVEETAGSADSADAATTEAVDKTEDAEGAENTEATEDAETAEDTEDSDGGGEAPGRSKRSAGALKRLASGKIRAAVLALLVLASVGALVWQVYFDYLPDRDIDAKAAKAALSAASEGTVAVLSYSPETIDHDLESARSHLTGDFLKYYSQFTDQIVRPATKEKSVKTSAVVLRAALSQFRADSATALLFVNQSTQSKDRPEPTLTSSSVVVTMTKADGKWLISSFNPV